MGGLPLAPPGGLRPQYCGYPPNSCLPKQALPVKPMPTSGSPRDDAREAERRVARFFDAYCDVGRPGALYLLRSPRRTIRFLRDAAQLPVLTAAPSPSVDGVAVRDALVRPTYPVRTVWQRITAVLEVPERPADYLAGGTMHRLRRRSRIGDRAGMRWRSIDDPGERRALLAQADAFERKQAEMAGSAVDPRNEDMLPLRVWLLAEAASGEPLLLAAAAVDGEWAALRYYRVVSAMPEGNDARYWLMPVLVARLAALGVRYVADTVSPANLSNGLRHFQRAVGFRFVDVRLGRERRRAPVRPQLLLDQEEPSPHHGAVTQASPSDLR